MKFRLLVEFVTQTKEKFQKPRLFFCQPLKSRGEVCSVNLHLLYNICNDYRMLKFGILVEFQSLIKVTLLPLTPKMKG